MNYREHPGIGGTDARQMVRDFESWAFERRLKLAGQWPSFMEKGPSDAMKFGTMVHMACLEPIKFQQHLVTCPQDINFTTKIGRAWKDAFSEYEKDNPGAFFLKEEQVWAIRHIAASFQKVAPPGIPGITYSVEKEFLGDWKGYLMKGCLDILTDDEVIDVKTTRDISRCVQTIAEERYGVQLYHYQRLCGKRKGGFIFLESAPPFRARYVEQSEEQAWASSDAWLMAMERAEEQELLPHGRTE